MTLRKSRGAVVPLPLDPGALATDRFFKNWAGVAGLLGANLNLLAALCGTDKYGLHFYTPVYEALLKPIRRKRVSILELGVGGYDKSPGGESLLMWAAYFRKGKIYGIDIFDKTSLSQGRIKVYQCSQTDRRRLTELAVELGPFDLVLDDGSHENPHQIESFRVLWPVVRDGAVYIVEDVQTSYWPLFGGGPVGTPAYGKSCMGYFKTLADSVNECEFLAPAPMEAELERGIGSVAFHHNLIVVTKDSSPRHSSMDLDDKTVREQLAGSPLGEG
jgi:demethylmacrocin O-methyltransferase